MFSSPLRTPPPPTRLRLWRFVAAEGVHVLLRPVGKRGGSIVEDMPRWRICRRHTHVAERHLGLTTTAPNQGRPLTTRFDHRLARAAGWADEGEQRCRAALLDFGRTDARRAAQLLDFGRTDARRAA